MHRKLAFALGLAVVVGCASPQAADLVNLATAGQKLASNPADPPIGSLTSAEWVAVSNNLPQLVADFPQLGIPQNEVANVPALTQQQADDLVAFMAQYHISNVSDLETLAQQVAAGTVTVQIPASLQELVASLGHPVTSTTTTSGQ